MRVLFNGTSTIRQKSGVGHTTINLHRALSIASSADQFWLYPGNLIRNLAAKSLKHNQKPTGARPSRNPARNDFINRFLSRSAYAGYTAHFHTVARLGRFDLYHEPNMISFNVRIPTV